MNGSKNLNQENKLNKPKSNIPRPNKNWRIPQNSGKESLKINWEKLNSKKENEEYKMKKENLSKALKYEKKVNMDGYNPGAARGSPEQGLEIILGEVLKIKKNI